jgi:ABC-type phosphate/phosphonate transport system substrate-binding protein
VTIRFLRGAGLLLLSIRIAVAQQDATGKPAHAHFNGVVSSATFTNLNHNDARAAIKVYFDIVAQRRGLLVDSKVDIVDTVTEIRERLLNHSVDLMVMSVADYLELENSHLIVPALTHALTAQGGASYSYLLLVNPSSGITALASLRGKNVLVASRGGSNTGIAWLEVLLGKEKLGRAASFLASVKVASKAQSCILPLFFGSADACVVDEVSLGLAREMNPQLGHLGILARSQPMVGSVIATPAEPSQFQQDLIDTILSLHDDARGRQLLMVFKTDRVVRIQPNDLDTARELWKDFYRLPGSSPGRPPAPTAGPVENRAINAGKEGH